MPKSKVGKSGDPRVRFVPVPQVGAPSDPATWGSKSRNTGFVIELPSGETARVRRTLDLPSLLESGNIPNPLALILKEVFANNEGPTPDVIDEAFSQHEDGPAAAMQFMKLVDNQMPHIFMEPKVVIRPAPDDERFKGWECPADAIELTQLELNDKMYVYRFAQGGPLDVASFREKSEASMAAVFDGKDAEETAEPTGGAD